MCAFMFLEVQMTTTINFHPDQDRKEEKEEKVKPV